MDKRNVSEWLSLSEAAEVLGVHPGTVRNWSNQGVLPVHRTRGGHRRYKRSEVELWKQSQADVSTDELTSMMQKALMNTRMYISEGRLTSEEWYLKLDDDARQQYRQSGRILLQGLFGFLNSGGREGESEAHAIGYEYAIRARKYGLSVVNAAQAFFFFRNMLIESMLKEYEAAAVRSPHAWSDMFRKINEFTDQIMAALLETYDAFQRNGK